MRFYRYKKKEHRFFCPLCRVERGIALSPRLTGRNYLQLLLLTIVIVAALYPLAGIKTFASFFILWAMFEFAVRSKYKQEIPCPHCGFDATWYQKDVKIARELVKKHHASAKS